MNHIRSLLSSRYSPLVLLALAGVLAYGPGAGKAGFYWDDLPMSWIRYQLGPQAMSEYFSTNRPVWGLLYQATTRLLPQVPLYWQAFAIFWRIACAWQRCPGRRADLRLHHRDENLLQHQLSRRELCRLGRRYHAR